MDGAAAATLNASLSAKGCLGVLNTFHDQGSPGLTNVKLEFGKLKIFHENCLGMGPQVFYD